MKIFVAQPAYGAGCFERESYDAPDYAADAFEELGKLPYESSLLAKGFNRGLCECLNANDAGGDWDEFCLLHGDVLPRPREQWLSILVAERDRLGLDVIHAPCAIKDGDGLTSTAVAVSGDPWDLKRRITTTELHQLPETFTVEDVRRVIEPRAVALLPNTGCLLFSAKAAWLDAFPGFEIRDRIVRIARADGQRVAQCVPEDWNFGYWAHSQGLKVGGTRLVTPRHVGKIPYMTEVPWGAATDPQWEEQAA